MKHRKSTALLSHGVIVFALSLLVLIILDIYNPMLGFLSSPYSRGVMGVLIVLSLTLGIISAVRDRRSE